MMGIVSSKCIKNFFNLSYIDKNTLYYIACDKCFLAPIGRNIFSFFNQLKHSTSKKVSRIIYEANIVSE